MGSTILSTVKGIGHAAVYQAYKLLPERSFVFNGSDYRYFYHRYNNTCETERSIEIPIALDFLQSRRASAVLEVGNVLNHYEYFQHTVVDKYEVNDGVINIDVCDFTPDQGYDTILSISTLEHVGWDEEPFDSEKAVRAIERLRRMLTVGGRMLVSFPVGHNSGLDQAIRQGTLGCSDLRGMKRTSGNNWVEVAVPELIECQLDPAYRPRYERYRPAKAVVFAYF